LRSEADGCSAALGAGQVVMKLGPFGLLAGAGLFPLALGAQEAEAATIYPRGLDWAMFLTILAIMAIVLITRRR
jgi:hypothetical protein